MNNAELIQLLHRESPTADAAETLGKHMAAMAPQPNVVHVEDGAPGETRVEEPAAPTEAGIIPGFIAKTLCATLPLLRKFVKVSGQVSDAIDILIAFVCSQN